MKRDGIVYAKVVEMGDEAIALLLTRKSGKRMESIFLASTERELADAIAEWLNGGGYR